MPGDDLRTAPYYTKTADSPVINLLFAALYDLIICRITKMSSLAPGPGRTLQTIFQEKIPKIQPADPREREKFVVGPELIAYLKWLIYSAAFKDPYSGERGAVHAQYYANWVSEIVGKEKGYRKKLLEQLEIWYAKHLPRKKRGRESIEPDLSKLAPGSTISLDDWEQNDSDDAGGAGGDE